MLGEHRTSAEGTAGTIATSTPNAPQAQAEHGFRYSWDSVDGNTKQLDGHVSFKDPEHYPSATATPHNAHPADSAPKSRTADIDSADGKTKHCDRDMTFETFVEEEKLGDLKPQKRTGHTWEVYRAVGKLCKKVAGRRDAKRT